MTQLDEIDEEAKRLILAEILSRYELRYAEERKVGVQFLMNMAYDIAWLLMQENPPRHPPSRLTPISTTSVGSIPNSEKKMTDWLNELDRLEREATEAPWEANDTRVDAEHIMICDMYYEIDEAMRPAESKKNADFVATFRNHACKLIDAAKQNQKRAAFFEKIQWSAFNMFQDPCCPVCEGTKESEEHEMGCELVGML